MATPQITIRVDKETLRAWQDAAEASNTNVSEQIRVLMNQWEKETNG